jgi:prepilin-type N-terminal cleavage/methylation domain-containing protein
MKKTFSSKKSAFSLIELSIVLIIIGLLIAGVTGGASLIKSSQLRSAISEARGYAVAVNSFYSQFNAYPGDYSTATIGAATAGNGNGTIEYYGTSSVSESANAWLMLKNIGAIDTTLVTTTITTTQTAATTSPTFGTNAPSSKIQGAGWAFDYRILSEGATPAAANQNVVVLTSTIGTAVTAATNTLVQGTNVATAALPGSDALSIDTKIDDGYAQTGKVRGLNIGSATTGCYNSGTTSGTSAYTVTSTSKTCALTYQVDVNS